MADKLKGKSQKDLARMLEEKRIELRSFRFGIAGSKTKNVRAGRGLQREIARILTEISVGSSV
ncbi:MAG: 50S ribosomal protein L29 [Patescibacteria group bacterium]